MIIWRHATTAAAAAATTTTTTTSTSTMTRTTTTTITFATITTTSRTTVTRLLQLPVLALLRLPDLIAADSATAFSVARWVTTPSYMAFRAPMANFAACDFLHFPPLRAACFSSLESWNTDPTALFADETDETRPKGPKGLNCEVMALSHHTEYLLKDDLLGLQTGTTSSFAR